MDFFIKLQLIELLKNKLKPNRGVWVMAKEIKILGPGCLKCELLYENVLKAIEELGIEVNLIKIKDLLQIASHGVLTTPGLVIDGKVISQGKVLSVEEIKKILQEG